MNNKVRYFKENKLKTDNINYGFFTKIGGISTSIYDSLNCSFNTKDLKSNVKSNIKFASKKLNFENKKIKFINQVHSNKIELINSMNIKKEINADGSITFDKNICLAILTADCAPIFIFDTKNSFICALHSGWRGCLNNIIFEALKKIKKISNDEIIAIIGPCLNQKNFEVNDNFKKKFLNKNPLYNYFFKIKKNKKIYFNMRGLINMQLKDMSIKKIYNIKNDTYSESNLFYSYRRAIHNNQKFTGRMINIIGFQ